MCNIAIKRGSLLWFLVGFCSQFLENRKFGFCFQSVIMHKFKIVLVVAPSVIFLGSAWPEVSGGSLKALFAA